MFEADLLLSMLLMSLFFLRHIMVYKDRNKINYTPVVLSIGVIAALMHIVMVPNDAQMLLALKESLLTFMVGVVYSAIMGVMSQTQNAAYTFSQNARREYLSTQIDELKASMGIIASKMGEMAQMETTTHEQLKEVFKEELEALVMIQNNQKLFISKIESILNQQQTSMEKFEDFTLNELPSLDNVVHRHIDLLRISEQDHFNQLKHAINDTNEEKITLQSQLQEMHEAIKRLAHGETEQAIIHQLEQEISRIAGEFAHKIQNIGSKSEAIVTRLLENEAILKGAREQSELIMQQMVLSSHQMKEMNQTYKELHDSTKPLGELFLSAEALHKEIVLTKSKLNELVITLEAYEKQEHRSLRENLENVANEAIAQMKLFSEQISNPQYRHEITPKEVQELAHKVKLHQSYSGE